MAQSNSKPKVELLPGVQNVYLCFQSTLVVGDDMLTRAKPVRRSLEQKTEQKTAGHASSSSSSTLHGLDSYSPPKKASKPYVPGIDRGSKRKRFELGECCVHDNYFFVGNNV